MRFYRRTAKVLLWNRSPRPQHVRVRQLLKLYRSDVAVPLSIRPAFDYYSGSPSYCRTYNLGRVMDKWNRLPFSSQDAPRNLLING
jgi:hypothetical protein